MFLDYAITDNCRETVLYDPTECLKLYNCLNIKDFNDKVNTLRFFHNTNSSKSFEAKVVRTNGNQIFFGPAFENIDNIANWSVQVNDIQYEINEDNFISIGSILLPDVLKAPIFYARSKFRIISENNDIYSYLSFDADFVNTHKTQFYGKSFIEIAFSNNQELSDFINNNDNLSVQILDNPQKDVDIRMYVYVGGGYPFDEDGGIKYKLILEDLVYNTKVEKLISRFGHEEKLRKSRYKLWVEDKEGSSIDKVNGLDFFEGKISLDTTILQQPIQLQAQAGQQETKTTAPALAPLFEVFQRK